MSVFSSRIKKVLKRKFSRLYEFQYLKFSKKMEVVENTVLIESTHGRDFSGHVFYITKELVQNYPEIKIFIGATSEKKELINSMLVKHNLSNSTFVVDYLSKEYVKALATSQYLINDTSFWDFFNKRPEQIYFNIWHGTPLKCLGRDIQAVGFGNVQKNFLSADYLIVSNDYTRKKLVAGFMLDNISSTKVLVGPSPRNSILFDEEVRAKVRNELENQNKKVYLYMPTYRDNGTSIYDIEQTLIYLNKNFMDDEKIYVKLHPFDVDKLSLDLTKLSHVELYPWEYETYEFLTSIDILITDYSSIMYDYLCTNKKTILYTYDKEKYYADRGLYEDVDDYPLPQVKTKEELLKELRNKEIDKNGVGEFEKRFISNDSINGNKEIVRYMFNKENSSNITEYVLRNQKDNVIFYAGGLWDNGISRAFLNTIDSINLNEKNYVLYIKDKTIKKEHIYKLQELKIPYILSAGIIQYNLIEGVLTYLYLNTEWFGRKVFKSVIENKIFKMYRRDFRRIFGGMEINHFIHYTGFERSIAAMLSAISNSHEKIRTSIFCHTDIFDEYKAKKNISLKVLKSCYQIVDQVILVNKELEEKVKKNFSPIKELIVLDNFLGFKEIKNQSNESIFSSLLGTPLTYGFSEYLYLDFNREFTVLKRESLKKANKLIPIIKKHSLGRKNLFPNIEKNWKEFEKLFSDDKLQIDQQEIGYIYGASKLELIDDLLNPKIQVFVNIGRFDVQKGHDRLINSFVQVNKQHPNTRLVIIAPHGPLKKQTIQQVRNSGFKDKITILGGMDNPYSLLKMADAFVFTSIYEGLGLVVFEALAVGTDVITVDIPATTEGVLRGSEDGKPAAMIVENTQEGITEGWLEYMLNKPEFGNYNFEKQEENSLKTWERIIH